MECKKPQDAEYEVQQKLGLHEDSTPKIILDTKKLLEEWDEEYLHQKTEKQV